MKDEFSIIQQFQTTRYCYPVLPVVGRSVLRLLVSTASYDKLDSYLLLPLLASTTE